MIAAVTAEGADEYVPPIPGDRFIRAYWQQIEDEVALYVRRVAREIGRNEELLDLLVSETALELHERWMSPGPKARELASDPARFVRVNIKNCVLDARRQVDSRSGAVAKARMTFVDDPPQWMLRLVPEADARDALLIVWYYARGYDPDERTGLPYERILAETGVSADRVDAALQTLASERPEWFDANFGTGLIERSKAHPPRSKASTRVPEIPDSTEPDNPSIFDQVLDLMVERGMDAEQALTVVIGSPSAVEEAKRHPEWHALITRLQLRATELQLPDTEDSP